MPHLVSLPVKIDLLGPLEVFEAAEVGVVGVLRLGSNLAQVAGQGGRPLWLLRLLPLSVQAAQGGELVELVKGGAGGGGRRRGRLCNGGAAVAVVVQVVSPVGLLG